MWPALDKKSSGLPTLLVTQAPPLSPSLFDPQVNGFAGVDFQAKELSLTSLQHAVARLANAQTLSFFPTFISDSIEALAHKLQRFEVHRANNPEIAAACPGYHLEGPWLSPEPGYRGAHEPQWMRPPERSDFDFLQDAANGRIRLVTLAPEWPGMPGFIRHLAQQGVHVSIGHSNADDRQIDQAIEAGLRFCTHLGNGVPQVLPRHDNIIQRLLARDELTAMFIPDGVHLPPPVLQNFFRAKPAGKTLFTTDCMAAAGAPPGRHTLGSLSLEVGPDRVVRLPGQPYFAGSSLTPPEGVNLLVRWLDLPQGQARHLFSTAPASAFGVELLSLP